MLHFSLKLAVNGTIEIEKADVVLTYVTTDQNMSTLLVHLANNITETRTIASVLINGEEMLANVSETSLLILPFPASVLLQLPLGVPVRFRCIIVMLISQFHTFSLFKFTV